jgi:hypothetical protein
MKIKVYNFIAQMAPFRAQILILTDCFANVYQVWALKPLEQYSYIQAEDRICAYLTE